VIGATIKSPRLVERGLIALGFLRFAPAVDLQHVFFERLDVAELGHHLVGVLLTLLRIFRQHLEDHAVHFRRHVGIESRRLRHLAGEMFLEQIVRAAAAKRRITREHLEQRNAQAVDVRSRRDGRLEDRLGRNVGSRPLDGLLFAAEHFRDGASGLRRQREVDQLQLGRFVEEDVVRFDVAMHIAEAMKIAQHLAELFDQPREAGLHRSEFGLNLRFEIRRAEVVHQDVPAFFV